MSWAEIKKAINSNISKSLDVLITEKCNELQSKLNSVYNTVTVKGNIPSVKSVQRGKVNRMVVSAKHDGYNVGYGDIFLTCYYDIAINSVNIDKSIVLCAGSDIVLVENTINGQLDISYRTVNTRLVENNINGKVDIDVEWYGGGLFMEGNICTNNLVVFKNESFLYIVDIK